MKDELFQKHFEDNAIIQLKKLTIVHMNKTVIFYICPAYKTTISPYN